MQFAPPGRRNARARPRVPPAPCRRPLGVGQSPQPVLQQDARGAAAWPGTLIEISERKELEHQLFDAAHRQAHRPAQPCHAAAAPGAGGGVLAGRSNERFCADVPRLRPLQERQRHPRHAAGDELLQQIAMQLRGALRVGDVHGGNGNAVARFGGDEFVVLLRDARTAEEPLRVARRLLSVCPALSDPRPGGSSSASIGIVLGQADGRSAEFCCATPTSRCTRPKRAGRATAVFFDPQMHRTHRPRADPWGPRCGGPSSAASCRWSTSPSSTPRRVR